ncbi:hypothetical protein, partial [Paracoccus sp. (in: a-proteobacteria)]|uniref:hypothetical protein n=1 Tax=Paracoccus sp. TaxID=267 RepID=UPI003A852548
IARDDAVVARQDAESAAASASTSLNMLSEVAGRSNAVISDTFLVSSDWVRYGSEGTLTKLPNSVYPVGRDWRFSVSGTQNDGIAVASGGATAWPGQVNAEAYAVEVEFTLGSGALAGAHVEVRWANQNGTFYIDRKPLNEIVAGQSAVGKTQIARAILVRPASFSGTFQENRLVTYANTTWSGYPGTAKTITFHRISIRPATEEELGRGTVLAGVRASISEDHFTRAETTQAIAQADLTLNASLGPTFASVSKSATALSSLNGSVARFTNVASVNGENRAGIEAVSFNNDGQGSGSLLKLIGNLVIADGTLSARKLVLTDAGNYLDEYWDADNSPLIPNGWSGIFDSTNPWEGKPSVGISLYAPTIAYRMTPIPVKPGETFTFRAAARRSSNWNGTSFNSKLRIGDQNNGYITQFPFTVSEVGTAWGQITGSFEVPSGVTELTVQLRNDATQGWLRLAGLDLRRQKSASTLLLPGSVTSDLITASTVRALLGQFESLGAANLKVGNAEINTLHLAGQAVTLPVAGEASNEIRLTSTNGQKNLVSCSLSRIGAPTLVIMTCQIAGYVSEAIASFKLLRNGNQIGEWPSASATNGTQTSAAFLTIDMNTGQGNTTYTLTGERFTTGTYTGDPSIGPRAIAALHIKR